MARQFVYHMQGLTKAYPGRKVLDNVNLSFYPDAKIGVLGVNGAGKSTLLRIMAGIETDFTGEGYVAEGARVGYLQQEPQLDPAKSVRENVMEGVAAQKAILDQYALSQSEARSLSQQLLNDLSAINGKDQRVDQNIAASVLFKMNVSPVAVGNYSFGGDNHGDTGLKGEAAQTVASCTAIADFITRITSYGMKDQVTMAFQNVFGRTLSMNAHSGNGDGRNHNANHHCTVMIGAGFKQSLVGGVKLQTNGNDYQATGIDSTTGASNDGGDIPYTETLGSVGKTLGAACGVAQADLDTTITYGKVVKGALAS